MNPQSRNNFGNDLMVDNQPHVSRKREKSGTENPNLEQRNINASKNKKKFSIEESPKRKITNGERITK